MTSVLILKLNGWPDTFNERVSAIAENVEHVTVVRSAPKSGGSQFQREKITTYDLKPTRGPFVKPAWLKPGVFSLHTLQAVILLCYLMARRDKQPDVIHAIDYALGGFAGAAISRLFSVPFVVSVRGLKEPRYRQMAEKEGSMSKDLQYRILTKITEFVIPQADHVVTKAPYQVRFVRETFGVNPEFSTIPTGVDFDVFDPQTISSEERLQNLFVESRFEMDSEDKIVLYLSKMVPEKGPQQIISLLHKANSNIPDEVVFAFVGEFRDPEFKRNFRNALDGTELKTFLHSDRVPFGHVPELLYDADAVILLSESGREGAPRILQESCAIGTPIIASDVDGISDAFEGLPSCYLIDRTDHEALVKAVTGAVHDSGDYLREAVAERFNMYRNYAKYAEIYNLFEDSTRSE